MTNCSTPGCQRTPRPNYAICDADILELVAPRPAPPARVARVSDSLPALRKPAR